MVRTLPHLPMISRLLLLLGMGAILLITTTTPSAAGTMKGPPDERRQEIAHGKTPELETSGVKLVLQGAIRIFQQRISPIDGPRCGFSPTCSRFGSEAVSEEGALAGLLMTADRLIRCNPWKINSGIYESLANGKLSDPVADNVLFENK